MQDGSEAPSFDVRVVERDDTRVHVAVAGELDAATAGHLLDVLEGAADGLPRQVEVDLSEVSFIDSTGVGVLVRAHNRVTNLGGPPLRVRGARPQAFKVLEVTGLTRVFEVAREDDPGGDQGR